MQLALAYRSSAVLFAAVELGVFTAVADKPLAAADVARACGAHPEHLHYLLVPAAGGERVVVGDLEVHTLTPQSPLGRALLGLTEGDEAELPSRGSGEGPRCYEILKVR